MADQEAPVFSLAFDALNFAQRSFAAFEIFALAVAEGTRLFLPIGLPLIATSLGKGCFETDIVSARLKEIHFRRFALSHLSKGLPWGHTHTLTVHETSSLSSEFISRQIKCQLTGVPPAPSAGS